MKHAWQSSSLLKSLCTLAIALGLIACGIGLVDLVLPAPSSDRSASPSHNFLAFVAVTQISMTRTSEVYLFDPATWNIRTLGNGNAIQWSPRGSYLAVIRSFDDQMEWQGTMESASVWNLATFTHNECGSGLGNLFLWSQDEKYIVTGWGSHHGCYGFSLWTGDGSKEILGRSGYCAQGDNIGSFPIRWEGGRLLVHYLGYFGPPAGGPPGLYLINPETGGWELVEQSTGYSWSPPEAETRTWLYPAQNETLSADGTLRAIAWGASLSIARASSWRTFSIPLPARVTSIEQTVWSPQ